MPAQPVFESIANLLYTTDDVSRLSDALDSLQSALYKTDKASPIEKMDEFLPHTIAESLKTSFKDAPPSTPQDMKQVIEALKEGLQSVTTISLTLAVDPPAKVLERLSEWIKKSYGANAVMDVSVNQVILGGAIIIHKGTYLDLSLKKKLDMIFEAKKQEIESLLKDQSAKTQAVPSSTASSH